MKSKTRNNIIIGLIIAIIVWFIPPVTNNTEAIMAVKQLGDMTDYIAFQTTQKMIYVLESFLKILSLTFFGRGLYFWCVKSENKNENEK